MQVCTESETASLQAASSHVSEDVIIQGALDVVTQRSSGAAAFIIPVMETPKVSKTARAKK